MARVTVEDCILQVPNRFDLVMLAARRAREMSSGATLTVERDNDKNPVVALREIAESTIDLESLRNDLVQGLQKHIEKDEPEDDGGFGAGGAELLSEMMQSHAEPVVPEGVSPEADGEEEEPVAEVPADADASSLAPGEE